MPHLLEKLLKRQGIESIEKMEPEERKTFDEWRRILAEGEITVDKIVEFCRAQIMLIEAQWKQLDNPQVKNERLVAQHVVYSTLLKAIESPQAQRESLEKHLRDLIES